MRDSCFVLVLHIFSRVVVERPYDATKDVQYQHETAVSQNLWVYYIAAIVKSAYYVIELSYIKRMETLVNN